MSDIDEAAKLLRAHGWSCAPPWTPETCQHPTLSRVGAGSVNMDGSGAMEWRCRLCGKHERTEWPAQPDRAWAYGMGFQS